MREVVFRGKRIDNGEWVEGSYCHAEKLDRSGDEHFIIEYSANGSSHRVDPATVGQYIGLKDRNGKRIFEGDIIKDDWGKVYEVVFTTTQCGFMVDCKFAPSEYETGRYRLGEEWCDTIEVIGNIHDNPELMEVR